MWKFKQDGVGAIGNTEEEQRQAAFETSDLQLASFLCCRNFPFTGIKSTGDGRKLCVFFDSAELRYAVLDYAGDGVVPVRTFCMTLRDLMAMTR